MKKIIATAMVSSALFFGGNLYAESASLTNKNIQGSWILEYTKHSEASVETVKREDIWVFDNNKVAIKHIPREGEYYDQPPVNFKIENDKLKVSLLGRAGKFDSFTVINKEEKIMTLKARFGAIYQFVKK
jgi:hypothetical protein